MTQAGLNNPYQYNTYASPRLQGPFALLIYICLALWVEWPVALHPFREIVGGIPDSYQYAWYLGWFWHAVLHGLNPLFSYEMNWPAGFGLMYNTSAIAPSILFGWLVPMTSVVFVYNLVFFINFVLIGVLGRQVFREANVSPLIATLGGAMFCIMPYLSSQNLGHMSQSVISPLLGIVLLLIRASKRGHGTGMLYGLAIGLLCAVEFYTSLELMVTFALAATIFIVCLIVQRDGRRWLKRRMGTLHIRFWLGLACTAILLVIPGVLEYVVSGGLDLAGKEFHPNSGTDWAADLFSPFFPTHMQAIHFKWTDFITDRGFPGNYEERGNYIGVFMLALIPALKGAWRGPLSKSLLWFTAIMYVLSMGNYLHFFVFVTPIPLPWYLMSKIPFLNSALPIRLALYVDAAVVVWIVMSFEKHLQFRVGRFKHMALSVLVLLSVLCWLPLTPYPYGSEYMLPQTVVEKIGSEPVVWITPNLGYDMQALASTRYTLRTYNLYGFAPPNTTHLTENPVAGYISFPGDELSVQGWSRDIASIRQTFTHGYFLLAPFNPSGVPMPDNLNNAITDTLGPPLLQVDGCELWPIH